MIEFVFTLDYEIYGNGTGTLRDLVYEPTRRLISLFEKRNVTFVTFAEAVEFIKIEEYHSDSGITQVREQLFELYEKGFEIGLHLHPWWAKGRFENGFWLLDFNEQNICRLPGARIQE